MHARVGNSDRGGEIGGWGAFVYNHDYVCARGRGGEALGLERRNGVETEGKMVCVCVGGGSLCALPAKGNPGAWPTQAAVSIRHDGEFGDTLRDVFVSTMC